MSSFTNYYFQNLPGFNSDSGFTLKNHGKYPFLSHTNGDIFSAKKAEIKYLHFEKVNDPAENISYTCTEENLITLFNNAGEGIVVNHSYTVRPNEIEDFKRSYTTGYKAAIGLSLENELGEIYALLPQNQKIKLLEGFIDYCQDKSFFEGFATPECLFGIGYIQAFLLKAVKDYNLLSQLLEEEKIAERDNLHNKENIEQSLQIAHPEYNRITVSSKKTMAEIADIWAILLDDIKRFQKPVGNSKQLEFILNRLFVCKEKPLKKGTKLKLESISTTNRDLFELLMRISKELNKASLLNNIDYCNVLKEVFPSVYAHISSGETISRNWAKNNNQTMRILYKDISPPSKALKAIENAINKTGLNIFCQNKNIN